jgi:hypothetical protein
VIKGADFINNEENKREMDLLKQECREIILILAAILRKSKIDND